MSQWLQLLTVKLRSGSIYLVEFDRMLQSLIQQPSFNNVRGIVLGRAEKSCDMTPQKWEMMIKNKEELKNIPVIADADFGHTTPIFTFTIGGTATINATDTPNIILLYSFTKLF